MSEPFYFYTRLNFVELTGRRAKDITELLEGIKRVPGSSIYYHTHRFLQQHHYLSPEPPNDFAYWVTNSLQEDILGEKLASVDIVQFSRIRTLREKFIEIIERHLQENKRIRFAPQDESFHFMKCITFVLPTNYVAQDLNSFCEILKKITIHSLYYHVFESKLRLEKSQNDFSYWIESSIGNRELARKIENLDPYTQTLEDLRNKIIDIIKTHG